MFLGSNLKSKQPTFVQKPITSKLDFEVCHIQLLYLPHVFVSQQVTEDGESRTFEETISTAILSQPGKPKNYEIEENNNCKCK